MGFLAMGLSTVAGWLGLTQLRIIMGLVAVIGFGIVVTGAYVKGRMDQASTCKEAALEQKIAGLERDLKAQKDADAVAYAEKIVLEIQNDEQQAEIAAYEAELAAKGDNPGCVIDGPLFDRLRGKRQ